MLDLRFYSFFSSENKVLKECSHLHLYFLGHHCHVKKPSERMLVTFLLHA